MDMVSLQITHDVIKHWFDHAQLAPSRDANIFGHEWAVWSQLAAAMGVCCTQALAEQNKQLRHVVKEVRDFFIEPEGAIRPNCSMTLSVAPTWPSRGSTPTIASTSIPSVPTPTPEDVHRHHWRRNRGWR